MENPEGRGYNRLKDSKSLGEILGVAMDFERTARDYYRSLATRVSKPLRGLVKDLAGEEQRHYDLFADLTASPHAREHIEDRIRTPANDHKFSDYVELPDLGEQPDDQAVLQYAMGREHAAMEQYAALALVTPEGPIRDLFSYLSQEELAHKAELEKRYYAMVYSTNV
jgi:rubrerythrin